MVTDQIGGVIRMWAAYCLAGAIISSVIMSVTGGRLVYDAEYRALPRAQSIGGYWALIVVGLSALLGFGLLVFS